MVGGDGDATNSWDIFESTPSLSFLYHSAMTIIFWEMAPVLPEGLTKKYPEFVKNPPKIPALKMTFKV